MAHLSRSDAKTAIYTKRVKRARLAEQAADRVDAARDNKGVPRPEKRRTPKVNTPNIIRFSGNKCVAVRRGLQEAAMTSIK